VARHALEAKLGTGTVRDIARAMVDIADQGLRSRNVRDSQGRDESIHLTPLHEIVHGKPVQAAHWLERFNGEWRGDVTKIFAEAAI
jgi:glutamate--cysteine ligase